MFLLEHYAIPVMLFALLLGVRFYFSTDNQKTGVEVKFVSKRHLRVGVALLVARVTLEQIMSLGLVLVLAVIVSVILTMLMGLTIVFVLLF